jgi:hypothetical protein
MVEILSSEQFHSSYGEEFDTYRILESWIYKRPDLQSKQSKSQPPNVKQIKGKTNTKFLRLQHGPLGPSPSRVNNSAESVLYKRLANNRLLKLTPIPAFRKLLSKINCAMQ